MLAAEAPKAGRCADARHRYSSTCRVGAEGEEVGQLRWPRQRSPRPNTIWQAAIRQVAAELIKGYRDEGFTRLCWG